VVSRVDRGGDELARERTSSARSEGPGEASPTMKLSVALTATVGSFRLAADFHAPEHITALFGPSGSGKTLTLRSIAGLQRPEKGRIEVSGRVLYDSEAGVDLATRERRLGYVFQEYALFPHLSVGRNVAFGIASWERDDRDRRVAELLEMIGLAGHADRGVHEVSGGQRQRVALARALAPKPDVLLLDEPFSAVDARTRRRLRKTLLELQTATQIPMVLVTHDLSEVREVADWLVLYENGLVLQEGPTEEVIAKPRSERAAAVVSETEL
jgi:molybdate transport system ATP-binding protein